MLNKCGAYPNLFTYYEQDMIKFVMFFDYYNNIYQGWYEWLKEVITIEKDQKDWKLFLVYHQDIRFLNLC